MANTLKIIKKSTKVFWHVHNNLDTQKFAISDFEISLDGNNFKIVEIDGAKRYNYLVENISIVDETGTSSVEVFTNVEDFYNRLIALQYTPFYNPLATSATDNKFISKAGFTLTGANLTINANWIWKLLGVGYSNPANVIIPIPFCATGKRRLDYFVPNSSNGFTRISGPESTTILVAPSIPNENMYITYCLVTDSSVGDPMPTIDGNNYIAKQEKTPYQVYNSGEIDNTVLDDFFYGYLNFRGSVTNLKSIGSYGANIYSGKEVLVKNSQATNITIYHLTGDGFQFSFPNEDNFVLKPNEIIRFSMKILSPTEGVLEYVGIINSVGTVGIADVTGLTAELADRYTKSEVDSKVSSVYKFKGNVANYAALPSTGLTVGDVYNLSDTGANYAWTGTVWDELGSTVDISGKENTSNKTNTIAGNETSTSLYASIKGIVDWLTSAKIKSILGISVLSGSNTGDQDLSALAPAAISVVKISSNTTLDNSYNGKVILLTASCTLTLPNGLMTGFNYSVKTRAGVTLTYSLGGSVTILDNIGTTMAEKLSHTMANTTTANEYLSVGSL